MPESEFKKPVDSEEEIKLDSGLIYADWSQGSAFSGYPARLEVGTVFVGNGAKIEISGKSEGGKKFDKIKDTINANKYTGEIDIPEDVEPGDMIWFEVKLSANSIDGESSRIPVYPAPLITNMAWSAQEARRGDVLKLTADVERVEAGTEALVTILEYDNDSAHDKIVEIPAEIRDMKLELEWEYEYHEDADELPTSEEVGRYGGEYNPPEYFFIIDIKGFKAGAGQESGLLTFKDYIEIVLRDAGNVPKADERYVLHMPDGSTRDGNLDSDGKAREEGIPPGHVKVEFPDMRQVDPPADEVEQEETQGGEEEDGEDSEEQSGTQQEEEEGQSGGQREDQEGQAESQQEG
ncbi:MAG: hypothetical protein KOO63_09995 [Bacteroidales bacterium]|nr:hypothetical protein [Candidatus Latescibacterota bacterium]